MAHKPDLQEQNAGHHACGCVVDIASGVYSALCSAHWPMKKDPAWAPFVQRATEVDYIG